MERLVNKKIYIFRHGQTDWNIMGKLQGQSGVGLNIQGEKQAQELKSILQLLNIDKYFVSPLQRALQTARILEINYEIDDRIKEISFGIYEGYSLAMIEQRNPGILKRREKNKWYYKFDASCESYEDIYLRTRNFIREKIINAVEDTIGIIAHETVNKALIGNILQLDQRTIMEIKHPNDVTYLCNKMTLNHRFYVQNAKWNKGYIKNA